MRQARDPALYAGLSEAGLAPLGIRQGFGAGHGRLREDSGELEATAVTQRARAPAISVAYESEFAREQSATELSDGGIPRSGAISPVLRVQVPPRTPKRGKFPAKQTLLEHAARLAAGSPRPLPRGEAAMTAPLIAPLIPPRARPGAREHGRLPLRIRLPVNLRARLT